jgi:hypothetical protein
MNNAQMVAQFRVILARQCTGTYLKVPALVVWHNVAVVSEVFVAERTFSTLFDDLAIHQLAHFSRRS